MRYRLRTLLIAATIGPPVLALGWYAIVAPSNQSGLAFLLCFLAGTITLIAYWPRIVGKGG